jgi:hypothetical protein
VKCRQPVPDLENPSSFTGTVAGLTSQDTLAAVNNYIAISGRPQGPYTVKNREPVLGNPNSDA